MTLSKTDKAVKGNRKKTKFREVALSKSDIFGCCLYINGQLHSADKDEHMRYEMLVHPAMSAHGMVKEALVLGDGTGASVRELLRYSTVKRVYMVDSDLEFIYYARKHLKNYNNGAFNSPRTRVITVKPEIFCASNENKYDLIVYDMPSRDASYLCSEAFLKNIKMRLRPDGVLVAVTRENDLARINSFLSKYFKFCRTYFSYIPSMGGRIGYVVCGNSHDPRKIKANTVENRIQKNMKSKPKYYNGAVHESVFAENGSEIIYK